VTRLSPRAVPARGAEFDLLDVDRRLPFGYVNIVERVDPVNFERRCTSGLPMDEQKAKESSLFGKSLANRVE
jgi:hypothetical protein